MNMENGTLVRWNEGKGFGFIQPEQKITCLLNNKPDEALNIDVFIHISTLKHMARKPKVGDNIEFERELQADGKVRARRAHITGVAILASSLQVNSQSHSKAALSTNSSAIHHSSQHNSLHSKDAFHLVKSGRDTAPKNKMASHIITTLLLISLGIYGFSQSNKITANASEPVPTQLQSDANTLSQNTVQKLQPNFYCETAKTHCSHMKSCEEATFYLKNCPTTQMDGDGDGIPCERQHCGY
ncbi:excalibur calcium-binding domain-containing protein [Shewanella denitrificans]